MIIPAQWLVEAGVQNFRPVQRGYRRDDQHNLIELADIKVPLRNSGYSLDVNGFRHDRMVCSMASAITFRSGGLHRDRRSGSTDKQTVENQVQVLRQIAERRGWEVVEQYSDAGISGAKGRDGRSGLDQMLEDASKHRFDVVMAWAIDRLGRSLIDLLGTIQTLEACDVDIYLDQQSIDTTTPAGKLMYQVCGAFGEFERSMIRQRVNAGLNTTARKVGVGTGTVQRIKQEMATGPFAVVA